MATPPENPPKLVCGPVGICDRTGEMEEGTVGGRQEGWDEEPTDWSLWMEGGQEEEEYEDGPVASWGGLGGELCEVPVGSSGLRASRRVG